jgi:hypothetical protein
MPFDLISSPKSIIPGRTVESLAAPDFCDDAATTVPFFMPKDI